MKIAAIFILSLLILLTVSWFFLQEVLLERPAICKSCHFITPYYNKWEQSTHRAVPCLKCHDYGLLNAFSGQLRYIAGTYNPRPLTNVPDRNCLVAGCHDRRLIESTAIFTKWNIAFDHKPHFNEGHGMMKLHCRSCHSDIVQGEHMKVSINVCFLCHLNDRNSVIKREDCTICHTKRKHFLTYRGKSVDQEKCFGEDISCKDCHTSVRIGDGTVPQERCFFCHIDRKGKNRDIEFIHSRHVDKKQLDCFFCHQFVVHGNMKMSPNIGELIQ
jgi:hypothetical protein